MKKQVDWGPLDLDDIRGDLEDDDGLEAVWTCIGFMRGELEQPELADRAEAQLRRILPAEGETPDRMAAFYGGYSAGWNARAFGQSHAPRYAWDEFVASGEGDGE